MIPSLDLRLKSALRALTTVIIPAIDPTNLIAHEQAHLVCAHLGLMRQQLTTAGSFDLLELEGKRRLAYDLLQARPPGAMSAADEALRQASQMTSTIALPALAGEIDHVGRVISDYLDAVAASGNPEWQARSRRLVAESSASLAELSRAYFVGLGFESDASKLPDITEALSRGRLSLDTAGS